MSRWTGLVGAVVLGLAVAGCGTNGGDPVARQQVPAAPAESSQPDMDGSAAAEVDPPAGSDQSGSDQSGSDQSGSDQSGSDGAGSDGTGPDQSGSDQSGSDQSGSERGGSGGDHARKVGLPKSIRIREIGEAAFRDDVKAACGSPNGAAGCLTVTYVTEDDPGKCGAVEWISEPDKVSDGNGGSTVERGSTITATVFTCPGPDESTTPAPETDDSSTPEVDDSSTPTPETTETETAAP